MEKDLKKESFGLCYRCEHRAEYLNDKLNTGENGYARRPRYECGLSISVHSCYMYRPVRPYILKPNEGETRGLTWPSMISGRAHAVGVADTEYMAKKVKEGLIFFCQLTEKKVRRVNKAKK
jgi:hypothetical protein